MINDESENLTSNIKRFLFEKDFPVNLFEKNNIIILGIPIIISIAIKLILMTALFKCSINNDGILYVTAAKYYTAGEFAKGLALYPMPAYPLLLALIHIIVPDWIVSGYVISVTSMVLATIPLYYLTKELFGLRAAFWACLIFAVLPKFNEWSLYLSRDPLFLVVFGLCIYNGLKALKESRTSYFILTFILAWISILIRIEGVLFIFFYFFSLAGMAFFNREKRSHFIFRAFIWAGIPLAIALITLFITGTKGISINRFDQVFSEIAKLFSKDFLENYFKIYEFLTEAENHAPFSGWSYNLAALTRHYMFYIYLIGIFEILFRVIFPLSGIPLFIALKNKPSPSGVFIFSLGFFFTMLVYYSVLTRDFIASRFLMMSAFLLIPWVGSGTSTLCLYIKDAKYKKLVILLVIALITIPALKTLQNTLYNDNSTPRAAKWLVKNKVARDVIIATNDKQTSFYLDLETKTNARWNIRYYEKNKNKIDFQKYALDNDAKILVLKMKNENLEIIPEFEFYELIKTFSKNKFTTNVYKR